MKPEYYAALVRRVYPDAGFEEDKVMQELECESDPFVYEWVLYIIQNEDPWFGKAMTQEECTKWEDRMADTGRFIDLFSLLRISRDQIYNIKSHKRAYWF